MLDGYVYRTLEKFGNCVIGIQDIKRYGKRKIKKDLMDHGYNCSIKIIGQDRITSVYPHLRYNECTVILEVIK